MSGSSRTYCDLHALHARLPLAVHFFASIHCPSQFMNKHSLTASVELEGWLQRYHCCHILLCLCLQTSKCDLNSEQTSRLPCEACISIPRRTRPHKGRAIYMMCSWVLHLLKLLIGCVVPIHIRLVMLAVVELHDLSTDYRLQGAAA